MLTLIAIVVGGLLGGAWGEAFGALVGALIGWLFARSIAQARQIDALKAALARQGSVAQPADAAPTSSTKPDVPNVPPNAAPARVAAQPMPDEARAMDVAALRADGVAASISTQAQNSSPSDALPVPQTTPARAPAPQRPRSDPLAPVKAWLFGGNTIVKAGIGILFIGLAFLAKYASEHVQVPVELRLAGIGAVAVVLLVIGWRLRTRRAQYAQVLQGGAVAVMYLTLFAAFKFYAVLAVGPAFALMVVVAMLAAALAVLQDARALAVVGALGGFATPLLVSTGSGNVVALFTYYLVLDLGIAAVAWHRTWRSLNLIGFVATFGVATAWGLLQYRPERFAMSEFFLFAFFVVFVAIMLMPARRLADASARRGLGARADGWVNGSLLFGLPTVVFALQYGLVRNTDYGVALSALGLAAFYVMLALALRSRPQLALPFEGTLAVGTVFLTLVIPFALDARSTAGAWALEGAGLVWLGWRQSRGISRLFGYALLLLAGAAMLYGHDRHGVPQSPWNAYLFSALLAAVGSLVAARVTGQHAGAAATRRAAEVPASAPKRAGPADEALLEPLLIGWATLWLIGGAALQIDTFVPAQMQWAAWLTVVSVIALLYTTLALRLGWGAVAWPVIGHAPIALLLIAGSVSAGDAPFGHGGAWAWPVALAAHLWALRWAARFWPAPARTGVHAIGVLIVATLGALLGSRITQRWGDADSAWSWLGWLAVPAALLMLLPRASFMRRWPMRDAPYAYRTLAAGVLAVFALGWSVVANIGSDGAAQPLPHLPLLNPLDLGIACALVASALWLRSEGARAAGLPDALRVALLGVAGFVWLNAMLVRGFHHYAGVAYDFDAWSASLAVQTGLTLLWTTTALVLMWIAARRAASVTAIGDIGARAAWMSGAALLAAVVLKLLLVDLSGTGTVTRIVSFIGVGVLMLVIGYVAPLPARPEEKPHVAA